MEINWTLGDGDRALVNQIASRIVWIYEEVGLAKPGLHEQVRMDLTAVHNHIGRLRLEAMLHAPNDEITHDVMGIRKHLDRETMTLGEHFLPKFMISMVNCSICSKQYEQRAAGVCQPGDICDGCALLRAHIAAAPEQSAKILARLHQPGLPNELLRGTPGLASYWFRPDGQNSVYWKWGAAQEGWHINSVRAWRGKNRPRLLVEVCPKTSTGVLTSPIPESDIWKDTSAWRGRILGAGLLPVIDVVVDETVAGALLPDLPSSLKATGVERRVLGWEAERRDSWVWVVDLVGGKR